MLALYDRNAEAPPELKGIETLYQPRGKQPAALNNTFEDDVVSNKNMHIVMSLRIAYVYSYLLFIYFSQCI